MLANLHVCMGMWGYVSSEEAEKTQIQEEDIRRKRLHNVGVWECVLLEKYELWSSANARLLEKATHKLCAGVCPSPRALQMKRLMLG